MKDYIYKNRDNEEIKVSIEEEISSAIVSEYTTTAIHIIEDNNDPLFKKDNPGRTIIPQMIDIPRGPFLFLGMDLNDLIMSKQEFLDANDRKIINKMTVEGPRILIEYEKRNIKKTKNA